MKQLKITFSIITLFTMTLFACKQHPARSTATASCTTDFGWIDSSANHPKHSQYNALLASMKTAGIPGAALMIQDSSGTWYGSMGMADIDNKTAFQPCHSIKIASITKLFTAVLAYKLIDEGKLSLTDKVSKYIDADIIKKLPNSELCTIADLMQHSSGIYDFVFDPDYILYEFNNLDKEKDYDKLLSFAYNKKPAFPYGSKREYNYTVNYILLAMCINKIEGQDHAFVQRAKVFDPLSMTHTFFRPKEEIPWSNVARGYFDYRKAGNLQDLTPLFTGDGSGFTGIYSTVNDMRKFMNAVYRNKTLLSGVSYTNLTTTNLPNDSISYAVGCRAYKVSNGNSSVQYFGHPGGEVAYASGAYYCPQKNVTITFIVNYGDAFDGQFSPAYLQFRKDVLKAPL